MSIPTKRACDACHRRKVRVRERQRECPCLPCFLPKDPVWPTAPVPFPIRSLDPVKAAGRPCGCGSIVPAGPFLSFLRSPVLLILSSFSPVEPRPRVAILWTERPLTADGVSDVGQMQ